ncbi:predicted protein [Plenodomus lingam JN3]|uniref:Uncharacterized protein n=1 Tax=Leptosphaeria maculans (strain JN3 / isolate v23.1.3 / race Av1-4-5-6-7-8) TaxID=985895 RepID=E5A7F3_LEPMJ|nr:predicted protein [Plenodomus lingam JN3]CBX99548.1 predicted protein [Plenodomus lingam JN3]
MGGQVMHINAMRCTYSVDARIGRMMAKERGARALTSAPSMRETTGSSPRNRIRTGALIGGGLEAGGRANFAWSWQDPYKIAHDFSLSALGQKQAMPLWAIDRWLYVVMQFVTAVQGF